MILAVRVRLILAGNASRVLPGVKIALFDRDLHDEDDYLGSGVTGENGVVRITFDSDQYADNEDQPAWRLDSLPDLYVRVYNSNGAVVYSTIEKTVADSLPDEITVAIPREVAERHNLLT